MSEQQAFRLGYRPALDAVRGLAILLVLAFHLWPDIFVGGWLGVDLFFVLSGFLITTLLLEEIADRGTVSLPKFYQRRALRLFPALFSLLLVIAIVHQFEPGHHQHDGFTEGFWSVVFYVGNWRQIQLRLPTLLGHLWSLSVEEQFYLLWPVLLLALLRRRGTAERLVPVLVGTMAAVFIWRLWLWGGPTTDDFSRCYYGTDTRADDLLTGCLLAILIHSGRLSIDRWRGWGPAGLAVLLLQSVMPDQVTLGGHHLPLFNTTFYVCGGLNLASLASAAIIVWALSKPTAAGILRHFGKLSYSLYLWHAPWKTLMFRTFGPRHDALFIAICFSGAYLLGLISYIAIEQPCNRLRHRQRSTATTERASLERARTDAG